MHLTYTCPNCDHPQELKVTPPTPAQISGPPERCYPAEDGEFEPAQCENCGEDFDYEKVMDAAADRCAELQSTSVPED